MKREENKYVYYVCDVEFTLMLNCRSIYTSIYLLIISNHSLSITFNLIETTIPVCPSVYLSFCISIIQSANRPISPSVYYFTRTPSIPDRYNPGKLMTHKWENAFTLDKDSWGYDRASPDSRYMTREELLQEVVSTVAYGGNCLVNVGPTADGRIATIFRRLLTHMGQWLDVNGEAIYATRACPRHQNDTLTPHVFYTCARTSAARTPSARTPSTFTRNAIFFEWPEGNSLILGSLSSCPTGGKVAMLGVRGKTLTCSEESGKIRIDLSSVGGAILRMNVHSPWTLKLEY